MHWFEKLALDALSKRLQDQLCDVIADVLDELVSLNLFPGPRSRVAIEKVTNIALISSEQVEELLKQLVITGKDEPGDAVFSSFCNVLRLERFAAGDLANALECEAETFQKTKSAGDEKTSRLVRSISTVEEIVEDVVGKKLAEQHGQHGVTSDKQTGECVAAETPERPDLVERLQKHLNALGKHQCKTATDHSGLGCLTKDIRKCFVPLQAMSHRDAMRQAFRTEKLHAAHKRYNASSQPCSRVNRRSGHAPSAGAADAPGKVFMLENAAQLLMGASGAAAAYRTHSGNAVERSTDAAAAAAAAAASDGECVDFESGCMLIGSAGQGKTTLCKRIIADVSDAAKRSSPLNKLKYVFYIACRHTERVTSPDWCVLLGLDGLGVNTEEQHQLLQYLSRHSDEVLVILDGIDEAGAQGLGAESAAAALLQRQSDGTSARSHLLGAVVVATSRPCAEAHTLVEHFSQHYRLVGFSESQLSEFCRQHLGETDGQCCMAELSQPANRLLKEAVRRTPLLCTLLVQQYSVEDCLPSSIATFYEQYLCLEVSKFEKRQRGQLRNARLAHDVMSYADGIRQFRCGEPVDMATIIQHRLERHVEELVSEGSSERDGSSAMEIANAIHHLNSLCLDALQRGMIIHTRTSDDYHLEICQELGLFVRHDGHPSSRRSHFGTLAHYTIQEWCASRAVITSDTCADLIRECTQTVGIDENTHIFWRFVFGALHPEYLCAALEAIRDTAKTVSGVWPVTKKMSLFMMRCLLESWQALGTGNGPMDAHRSIADHYEKAARMLCSDGIDIEGIHLDYVDIMAVRNALMHSSGSHLLNMARCNLSDEAMEVLSDIVARCVALDVGGNSLGGDPLKTLAHALSSATDPQLHRLVLTGVTLSQADGRSIASCAQLPSLNTLIVTGSKLGNSGLTPFVQELSVCRHLKNITFGHCTLQHGCGHDLAMLVRQLPCLASLWLHSNALSNADAADLLKALGHHRFIDQVNFQDNELNDDLAPSIVELLCSRRDMEQGSSPSSYRHSDQRSMPPQLPSLRLLLSLNTISVRLLEIVAQSGLCGPDEVSIGSHRLTPCSEHPQVIPVEEIIAKHDGELQRRVQDAMMPLLGRFLGSANCTMQTLDLSSCKISDDGATRLASSGLVNNASLLSIRFNRNKIQLAGVTAVVKALSSPPSTIRALILEWNPVFKAVSIGHGEHTLLLRHLSLCRDLLFVSLANTDMCDEIAAAILLALAGHLSLTWIDMARNDIGDRTVSALVKMKKTNRKLNLLSLDENKVTDAGISELLLSPDVMEMDGVHLHSNSCSYDQFRPPLYESALYHSKSILSDLVSDR